MVQLEATTICLDTTFLIDLLRDYVLPGLDSFLKLASDSLPA